MAPWRRTFVSAFIAQICSIAGFAFSFPFVPYFVRELGITDEREQSYWAGVVLAAAGVTLCIFQPIWGNLADRYGRKTMVVRAMFGGTLVLVLMSMVQTVQQLVICRLLQGALTGTIAASVALVASITPRRHAGFALGMMNSAVFIGVAGGPFFGGLVADAFGYRIAFLCGAGVILLGGFIVLFGTKEEFVPPDPSRPRESLGALLLVPGFFAACLVMLAVRLSNSIANPAFPLIVQGIHDNPKTLNTMTGLIIAVAATAGAISSALLGVLGDRHGHRHFLMACCAAAAYVSVAHVFATTVWHLIVLRLFFGAAVAGAIPAANAIISNVIPNRNIGRAFGWASSISMAGLAIGPFLGGYIGSEYGLRMPFIVTGVGQMVVMIVVVLFVKKSMTRQDV